MKSDTEKAKNLKKILESDFKVVMKKPTEVKPYWRNARDNSQSTPVVKDSMRRFGVTQPITIDKKGTIIMGHTRFKAMVELGYEEIPCIVSKMSQKDAKQYRIVDNKSQDLTNYIEDQLIIELREIGDTEFMQPLFPDISLNTVLDTSIGGAVHYDTQEEIDHKKEVMDNQFNTRPREQREVLCPHCGEAFYIEP